MRRPIRPILRLHMVRFPNLHLSFHPHVRVIKKVAEIGTFEDMRDGIAPGDVPSIRTDSTSKLASYHL